VRADPQDRPHHLREAPRTSLLPWVLALAAVLVALLGGYYAWFVRKPAAVPPPAAAPVAEAPPREAGPAVRHPLPAAEPSVPLPSLDMSDSLLRQTLATLLGSKAFNELVFPSGIVRRIVATVDNLPRARAPRRVFPVYDVPGGFRASGGGEQPAIAPENSARYARYVSALESLDAQALVKAYVQLYPLFQRAYEELGYPGRHFNDRLIEAMDDLLAAPEVGAPIRLIRPKVLYEYADPDLETRSDGQKILIRMGADNASRVKAKLREIRRALITAAAQPAKPPGS
jgi:hypothetical protein